MITLWNLVSAGVPSSVPCRITWRVEPEGASAGTVNVQEGPSAPSRTSSASQVPASRYCHQERLTPLPSGSEAEEIEQDEVGRAVTLGNKIIQLGTRLAADHFRVSEMVFRIAQIVSGTHRKVTGSQRSVAVQDVFPEPVAIQESLVRSGNRPLPDQSTISNTCFPSL